MAHTAARAARRARGRLTALAGVGSRGSDRRHPLVAAAMVLPLAIILAIAFGAVQAVVAQASSVAGMLGH
ncbi:hypothetical protein [Streptomyces winkii]|uniref:hypothetical protein n=1 Tax=Streptomyces winkii TaxID=3051178 RepID=UPI0028D4FA73|nr:hypothetical protein [Streptomyces sp. DSM 40971]